MWECPSPLCTASETGSHAPCKDHCTYQCSRLALNSLDPSFSVCASLYSPHQNHLPCLHVLVPAGSMFMLCTRHWSKGGPLKMGYLVASLSILSPVIRGEMFLYKHTLSLKVCLWERHSNRLVHNNAIYLSGIILLKDCFVFQDQC